MSTESEKTRIKPLDDATDYSLWRIRIEAACSAKGFDDILLTSDCTASDETGKEDFRKRQKQASNIIISALNDAPLRVVRDVIGDPCAMLKKLDKRYDAKTTASKITKITDLVGTRFSNSSHSIAKHIDKMAALIAQLKAMKTTIDEPLAVGLLVASIDVPSMKPVVSAIKTLAESDLTWESVAERLIEEHRGVSKTESTDRAHVAKQECHICGKENHTTERCFLNPLFAGNRLGLSNESKERLLSSKEDGKSKKTGNSGRHKRKAKDTERSAMARRSGAKTDMMMLDSGTSSHMTPHSERVSERIACDVPISLADNSTVQAKYKGKRSVTWIGQDGTVKVGLTNTLVSPKLSCSLLSVPALVRKGIAVLFVPGKAILVDVENDYQVLGTASQQRDGMFYISDDGSTDAQVDNGEHDTALMAIVRDHCNGVRKQECSQINGTKSPQAKGMKKSRNSSCAADPAKIWHLRLGHALPVKVIRSRLANGNLPPPTCFQTDCMVCSKSKHRRMFKGSLTKERRIGRLHCDTKGKIKLPSRDGHYYFLTIIDEYTRLVHVEPLRKKGDASAKLLQYVRYFERQTGQLVRGIHTDGGSEFTKALTYARQQGIDVSLTTAYTPESNGLAERTHSTILSLARASLLQAKLPDDLWHYAIRHVTQCKNMVEHRMTGKVPYEMAYGQKSLDVSHLRPFGCKVMYRPVVDKLSTFEPRLQEGVCLLHTGGGVYNVLSKDRVIRTKHVKFVETVFPGVNYNARGNNNDAADNERSTLETDSDTSVDITSVNSQYMTSDDDDDIDNNGEDSDDQGNEDIDPTQDEETLTYRPIRESRHGESDSDEDDDVNEEDSIESAHDPDSDYEEPSNGSSSQYAYKAEPLGISANDEPTLKTALHCNERLQWIDAIDEEYELLVKNKTWEPVDYVKREEKQLPSGIVLKLKRDAEGRPVRYKARVVARGNFQSEPEQYIDLYAPVASIDLVRTVLAVSVALGWDIEHVDVKGAFLNALLAAESRYVLRLPSIPGSKYFRGQLVRLIKSLYGLRESPKMWYAELNRSLRHFGFVQSAHSDSLFMRTGLNPVYIVAYVDDLLIFGAKSAVQWAKSSLRSKFVTTELGPCTHYLGVRVERTKTDIHLSQESFIKRVIDLAGLSDAKPCPTPLPMSHCLYEKQQDVTDEEQAQMERVPYRAVLGSLLYLATRTRPDIATAVSMLAKFQSSPSMRHWKAMKHVCRYLLGTASYGIRFCRGSSRPVLTAWTDADWARDQDKRRSRTGYVLRLSGGPVVWCSKMQTSVATSTTEAEFDALATTVRDVIWVRAIIQDLGQPVTKPTVVFEDNLVSISWTDTAQGLRNVKHVGIKYQYVREAVKCKAVEVRFTPTERNCADTLTKALIGELFRLHRLGIGVVDYVKNESH